MVITCPSCQARYRIDTKAVQRHVARVKCPACEHRFEISLEEESSAQVSAPAPVTPSPVEGRPKILVVDDAKFFREMIKDLLKDLPVEWLTAADGEEAWQLILSMRPQLVMLDLNIPGRSGKDILRELRSTSEFDPVRVVIMSGVERGESTAAEMRRCGADDFISKSFKPRELENRVRQILGL